MTEFCVGLPPNKAILMSLCQVSFAIVQGSSGGTFRLLIEQMISILCPVMLAWCISNKYF